MSRPGVVLYGAAIAVVWLAIDPSLARAEDLPVFVGDRKHLEWPAEAGDGAFGRAVVCELNGDGILDVVVIREDVVYAVIGFGVFDVIVEIDHANDVDVLAGDLPGDLDQIVVGGASGIARHGWNGHEFVRTAVAAGGPWSTVSRLRAGDLDRDGANDLVCVASDGKTVMSLLRVNGSIAIGPSTTLTDVCSTIEMADLDGVGFREIVAMSGGQLLVVDLGPGGGSTNLAISGIAGESGDTLAVLDGPGHDRVAWVSTDTTGNQWLVIVASDPTPTIVRVMGAGPALRIRSLAEAHFEGPYFGDDSDLLVTHRLNHHALLLLADATGGYALSPSSAVVVPELDYDGIGPDPNIAPNPDAAAQDLFADVDGDGDAELVFFVATGERVTYVENPIVPAASQRMAVSNVHRTFFDPELGYGVRVILGMPVQPAAGATHVELVTFRQADVNASLDPTPIARVITPISGANSSVTLEYTLPESSANFDDVYWMLARTVTLGSGDFVAAGDPLAYFALTANPSVAAQLEVGASGPSLGVVDVAVAEGDDGFVATVVPRPNIPPPPSPPTTVPASGL